MSHKTPAAAPTATLTLAARLKLPWMRPHTRLAGLCRKGSRLASVAAPTSASTTGSRNRPTGVRGLASVSQSEPAARSHAARRYQSNGLDSGRVDSLRPRQARNSVWATSPAAAKPIIAAPRRPDRNTGRDASQASATA